MYGFRIIITQFLVLLGGCCWFNEQTQCAAYELMTTIVYHMSITRQRIYKLSRVAPHYTNYISIFEMETRVRPYIWTILIFFSHRINFLLIEFFEFSTLLHRSYDKMMNCVHVTWISHFPKKEPDTLKTAAVT